VGGVDAFVTRLDTSGTVLLYSTFIGGNANDDANGVATGGDGAVYVAGETNSPVFPVTPGAYQTSIDWSLYVGSEDGFAVKLHASLADGSQGLTKFGSGTVGCSGPQVLWANSTPQIGNPYFAVTCSAAPATALGLLVIASDPDVAGSDSLGLGLTLHFSLTSPSILGFDMPSDPFGAGLTKIPIPNDPLLQGAHFAAQGIWLWGTGACSPMPTPFGLSSSNGLAIRVQ
jgi:hypothetical protein